LDLDSIEPGFDFTEVIREAVESSALMIVLIGPEWLDFVDEAGKTRIHKPDDYVRLEIQTALECGVRVVPVLIDGADPPRQQRLPLELGRLARLNALALTYERYRYDADRLLDLIQRVLATADGAQESQAASAPSLILPEKRSASDAKEALKRLGVPVAEPAFRNAVRRGDAQVVGLLVDAGIPVDTICPVPDDYITPDREVAALLSATMHGHIEVSLALVQRGAQPNACDQHGTTPLIIAAHRGYGLLVKALLQADADVEAIDNRGSTALMKAAERGNSDIVEMLITFGADLDKQDNYGRTALFRVAEARTTGDPRDGIRESGRRLLLAGADVTIGTGDGLTVGAVVSHGGPHNLIEEIF